MPIRHTGIVLKMGITKQATVALIDSNLGRVNGIIFSRTYAHGSLLSYDLAHRQSGYARLEHVRIENMPLALAAEDLLFVHHVLELCFEFIPVGSCVAGMFDLLLFLYSTDIRGWNDAQKLLFIFKLLAGLGAHPENADLDDVLIARLQSMPLLCDEASVYVAGYQARIHEWIKRCVSQHPRAQEFKTARFLMRDEP